VIHRMPTSAVQSGHAAHSCSLACSHGTAQRSPTSPLESSEGAPVVVPSPASIAVVASKPVSLLPPVAGVVAAPLADAPVLDPGAASVPPPSSSPVEGPQASTHASTTAYRRIIAAAYQRERRAEPRFRRPRLRTPSAGALDLRG
jgi:hypothetical protein